MNRTRPVLAHFAGMRAARCILGVATFSLLNGIAMPVACAALGLPAIFGDHMVLQEGVALPFWGTATPGETVTVTIGSQRREAVVDKKGVWRLQMPSMAVGAAPMDVAIETTGTTGPSERRVLADVLVGDVWLASGQSNMEWPLWNTTRGDRDLPNAGNPLLRLFHVAHGSELPPLGGDVDGAWAVSTPDTARAFSAVGYYFGRELQQTLNKPIAIIDSSWGGTPVEGWTRLAALKAHPEGRRVVPRSFASPAAAEAARKAYEEALSKWEAANSHVMPANTGEAQGWARAGIPVDGWHHMQLPGHWEDQGVVGDGTMWFRKDLPVPPSWEGRDLELSVGNTNDCDDAYVNATRIGHSCMDTPDTLGRPHVYGIPGQLVTPGRLLVALRIFDQRGNGGIKSPPETLWIQPVGREGERMLLAGRWYARAETLLPALTVKWEERPRSPMGHPNPGAPGGLWQTMIEPMVPFAIKGVIWYQGEANATRAVQYRQLFPLMIKDWRRAFGRPDLPFYFVQLAGFQPAEDPRAWAELREAQTMALKLPHTGMAVAIDVGDPMDIHPRNKYEVGRRLALWALARDYGQPLAYAGPLLQAARREKGGFRISFDHGAGLKIRDGAETLLGFEMAGPDRVFVPAEARIEGDTVFVSSAAVSRPAAVRYGWAGAPPCNLENGAGLPASPFRTDRWPEFTRNLH